MKNNPYIEIFTGTEVAVLAIKSFLEKEGILSIIENNFQSGNIGGFLGGTPTTVQLKVKQSDYKMSKSIIENQIEH